MRIWKLNLTTMHSLSKSYGAMDNTKCKMIKGVHRNMMVLLSLVYRGFNLKKNLSIIPSPYMHLLRCKWRPVGNKQPRKYPNNINANSVMFITHLHLEGPL